MLRPTRSVDHAPVQRSITVVIADHHPPIRHVAHQQLQNEPDIEVLAEAENGQDALALTHRLRPDVLMLEHHLPDMSTLHVLAQLPSAPPIYVHMF